MKEAMKKRRREALKHERRKRRERGKILIEGGNEGEREIRMQ